MTHKTRLILLLLTLLLIISVTPVLAQRTSITLAPVWRPGEQLTSDWSQAPADERFVDIQFFINGNVQFWATSITCSFGRTTFLEPAPNVGTAVTWGPDWGVEGTDFISTGNQFNAATNTLTFTAARQGSNTPPLGFNGQDYNMLLATVRMVVVGNISGSVPISCGGRSFLDRDGRPVVRRAGQQRTPPLIVRTGYTFSGQVKYQGARYHNGIEIDCINTDTATNLAPVTTGSAGTFSLSTLREFGNYTCTFTGAHNPFITSEISFNLQTPKLQLLPILLRSGDVVLNDAVDNTDVAFFTGGYIPGPTGSAYNNGDVNGDANLNTSDLAIVTANYGIDGPTDASHLIYGLATDYNGDWPNSLIYWGDPHSGAVQQLVNGRRVRDFWPALAPDGQRVAFICANDGSTTGFRYNQGNLCVINADGSNLQVLDMSGEVKIYPPAWFDNNTIIYAGTQPDSFAGIVGHPTCPGKLCSYDFNQNTITPVEPGTVFGGATDFVDMPAMSDNAGTPVLFYRYFNSGAGYHELRAAAISYTSATQTYTIAAHGMTTHQTAYSNSTNGVDYFAVSPTMSVLMTTYDVARWNGGNGDYYTPPYFTKLVNTGDLAWTAPTQHNVDGFVGNPLEVSGDGASGLWDGYYDTPTMLHIYRATVDWTP